MQLFVILQVMKNKTNHQTNQHATRHHAENCINTLKSFYVNDINKMKAISSFEYIANVCMVSTEQFIHTQSHCAYLLKAFIRRGSTYVQYCSKTKH